MKTIAKPSPGEFAPYAAMYIDLLPDDGLLMEHLRDNFVAMKKLVLSLPEEKLLYRYAAGKWSIKEILEHIVDDERIYGYRALRFARNDTTLLPGFDQDAYVDHSSANDRDLGSLLAEYEAVRRSTITMFEGFADEVLTRVGTADSSTMSVRAIGYHLAGHELHHRRIIEVRYLS